MKRSRKDTRPACWKARLSTGGEDVIFAIFLFFLPSNLAWHWQTPSALVLGIYRDYLIPALFSTDLLIISLLFLSFFSKTKILLPKKTIFFVFLLLFFSFIGQNKIASFYKAVKIFECFWLFYWLKSKKANQQIIVKTLFWAACLQAGLAIFQWFKQTSVLSYLPFGEQPFNFFTPNIKKIILPNGSIRITPLGTFPHSNVLAGFLLLVLTINLNSLKKLWQIPLYILIVGALILTFSLPALFLLFLLFLYSLFKNKPKLLFGLCLLGISGLIWLFYQTALSSLQHRLPLIKSSWLIIKDNFLIGVGLNNFLVKLPEYISGSQVYFFQPVHNLFLLLFAETGVVGMLIFLFWGVNHFQILKRLEKNRFPSLLLLGWFLLAQLDHYFYTLQQGLLITTIVFYLISSTDRKRYN